jgi:phage antirepressor YoqD-like protein
MNIVTIEKTMTSMEISELTGKRHDHVMRDIRVMLLELYAEGGVPSFGDIYQDAYNRSCHIFKLPKRESLILVSGYSVVMRAKIIDRWQELESAPAALNPANFSRLQLLELAMQAEQERLVLEQVVAVQTPQVQAFKLIAQAEGSLCFTDAAKTLQIRPKDLTLWLSANKWVYKRLGSSWIGYQERIQSNLIEHKIENITRPDGTTKVVTQARITPRGISALARVFKEAS